MSNLYQLHSDPSQLYGYDIAPYRIPDIAYELAETNLGLRKKLEPVIMKSPEWAYTYAHWVLNGRWPAAEPVIMKDPTWAYYYAVQVLRKRWPEAEPVIMKNPEWAYYYACSILKSRWPEAEPVIMKDPVFWKYYKNAFDL